MGVTITSVKMYPNEAAELAHKAKMRGVAEALFDGETFPSFVLDSLWHWSFEVQYSGTMEDHYRPTKGQLHRAASDTAKAMAMVLEVLKTPMMAAHLGGSTAEGESHIQDNLAFLEWLEQAAIRCMYSPLLVTPEGRLHPGRGKVQLPNSMPPKYVCAAVICEIWAFFHEGEDPGPSHQQAKKAAALFHDAWFASTGWGDDALKGWTRYFKSAHHPELATLRREVKRLLENEAMVHRSLEKNEREMPPF